MINLLLALTHGMYCASSDFRAGMTKAEVAAVCGEPAKKTPWGWPREDPTGHWYYRWPGEGAVIFHPDGTLDEYFTPDGDCVKTRAPDHICGQH